ncbi:MAG: response regulator transcription factor [Bacteroidetes bacterium]|nr:response regulator transcription factor [Bacteroidota bacterium]MBK9798639.1 response regulator transcription factor [Bacteroidota bacterium]
MNYKILVADSNYLLREGLKTLVSSNGSYVCDEVENAEQLIEKVVKNQPDVVIINFISAGFSLNDISRIKLAYTDTKILAITEKPGKTVFSQAIANGVLSFLMIDCDRNEITEAIESTLQGEAFFCGKILNEINAPAPEFVEDLAIPAFSCNGVKISARESEIISLVSEGMTNKQIAEQLFLSTHTVITHRKNIMNKLGLTNTASLVMFAIRQNIIRPNKFLFSN